MDDILHGSAHLVEEWGSLRIGDTTLKESLSFSGISLWDVLAPSVAVYIIPRAIAQLKSCAKVTSYREMLRTIFIEGLKPYLKVARDVVRERKEGQELYRGWKNSRADVSADILFLAFEPRQTAAFAPVMDLLEMQDFRLAVVGSKYRPISEIYVQGENRVFVPVERFVSKGVREETHKQRQALRERLAIARKQHFFETLAYNGRPLWPYLKNYVRSLLVYDFWHLVKAIELAKSLLLQIRPSIVIGADDCDPRARVHFLAAKSQGIPTLHIQYGLASSRAVNWRFMSTDKAAIMDSLTCSRLVQMGVDESRLVVTGQPRFDALIQRGSTAGMVRQEYGIPAEQAVVLFASQPYAPGGFVSERARRRVVAAVYRAAAQVPGATLLVKPHPDEDMGYHAKLRATSRTRATIVLAAPSADIQRLILGSDLLITFHSTSALEAILADKPVLLAGNQRPDSFQDYVDYGPVLRVAPEDISSAVADVLANGEMAQRLHAGRERYFMAQEGLRDGHAAQRCVDLIMGMMLERGCFHG